MPQLLSIKQAPVGERKAIFNTLVRKILEGLVKLPEIPGSEASDDY